MKLNPYLAFDGRCREAFEFYEKTLGGKIAFIQTIGESPMASSMPPEAHGRVMHVTLMPQQRGVNTEMTEQERNKDIVREYAAAFNRGDLDGLRALFAPDAEI